MKLEMTDSAHRRRQDHGQEEKPSAVVLRRSLKPNSYLLADFFAQRKFREPHYSPTNSSSAPNTEESAQILQHGNAVRALNPSPIHTLSFCGLRIDSFPIFLYMDSK